MFSSKSLTKASLASLLLLAPSVATALPCEERDIECRCFPGDECWSNIEWSSLNKTLGGKLIATVPLAAVCHDNTDKHPSWPAYNKEQCSTLQKRWVDPSLHYPDSSSTMAPYFVNSSCDPFSASCEVGNYVSYSVDVSGASDISAGIQFAKDNNIRLNIRNTGHDFNGKSTGPGSLSLWMHNLKEIEIKDWSDKYYTGKAIKMGAGAQGFEVNKAAFDQGLQVVTGSCPTVGVAGGYSQGGGHSALTSLHGLAADQVLQWELVTAQGDHVFATRDENTDLYWALSGGGGGTYGVVLSMTSKAHPDTPTAGANLTFAAAGLSQEVFYGLVDTFQKTLAASTDAGASTTYFVTNASFAIRPMIGPGLTSGELREFLQPFMDKLDELNVRYASYFGDFGSYTEFYAAMFYTLPVNSNSFTGRLIPRDAIQNRGSDVTDAYRFINQHGATVIGVAVNATSNDPSIKNSVNPGWRDAQVTTLIVTNWNFKAPFSAMQSDVDMITSELTPKLKEITPGGTTYLSESDFQDPDWKENFYGVNYARLEEIKNKYDPEHIFYATTAVGSDYWEPQADGRLCKA